MITRYSEVNSLKSLAFSRGYTLGPLYHGTSVYFTSFRHSYDFGFHFGTKQAAQKFMKFEPPELDAPELSPREKDFLSVATTPPQTDKEKVIQTLIRVLSNPDLGKIRREVENMDPTEIKDILTQYKDVSSSDAYLKKLRGLSAKKKWVVTQNGDLVISTLEEDKAKKVWGAVKKHLEDPAYYLMLDNPLEVPDLGQWPVSELANAIGVPRSYLPEDFYRNRFSIQAGYAAIKEYLLEHGFDGLVYTNLVEDPGKLSYIVLTPEQIKSAAPVTYDDDGEEIPSHKRFNPYRVDIRY